MAVAVERQALRPAEAVAEGLDGPLGRHAIDGVARRQASAPSHTARRRDRTRDGTRRRSAECVAKTSTLAVAHPQDRSRSIADEQRRRRGRRRCRRRRRDRWPRLEPIRRRRRGGRCRRSGSRRAAGRRGSSAIDVGLGRSDDERLARAVAAARRRSRPAPPGRATAEGDVEVALAIEGRAVDLVHAGRDRRADLDVGRLARRAVDADRGVPAVEARGDDRRSATGARRDATVAPDAAEADLGRLGLEAETRRR